MSLRELYEWYEYYSEEPFLADRLEFQLATVCNMIGGFGKSKLKHQDYMLTGKKKQSGYHKNDTDRLRQMFMSIATPVKV
jgi:hypothetical protein